MDEKKQSISNEVNQVQTVPLEISSELKFKGTIPVSMIIAAFLMFFIAQKLDWMVYAPLRIAWYIYNVIVAVLFSIKVGKNGEKRLIQSVLIYLTRNNNYYAPIDNPDEYEEMEVPIKDEA